MTPATAMRPTATTPPTTSRIVRVCEALASGAGAAAAVAGAAANAGCWSASCTGSLTVVGVASGALASLFSVTVCSGV